MNRVGTQYLLGKEKVINGSSLRAYYLAYPFAALAKIRSLSANDIIAELKRSGLRGRGGAAFPTWLKWQTVMQQVEPVRYVVANGEEGEPGTFKDRLLLEQNPLEIIEAMVIAAYTVTARQGYIYLNHSYREIADGLEQLLSWMSEDKRLGDDILETGLDFDIFVRRGRQRYIAGEETALFHALEGKRAEPASRPPFPTEKGLWGKPTIINNIETFSCIPLILARGGEWFASIGPEGSQGPKLFSVTGDIKQAGVYEASMEITLEELIEIAGGMEGNFKCAFVGGPSGKLATAGDLGTPLTIQNCVGNGTIIIFNDQRCAADLARHITDFFFTEHCGQCLPGRAAMKDVKALMDNLPQQQGLAPVLQRYSELHEMLMNNSKCGLCSSGTGMSPALMQAFPRDFENHLSGSCVLCEEKI
ncbi:MAG: NADH-ubiquinone oxidoreductase-F iron-sulfur binding region domain-containing protein [Thioalkalispiraceae bacterium]|jgi:NADH:ubiquinone oxidoreductase subunit F (NADH-binding)